MDFSTIIGVISAFFLVFLAIAGGSGFAVFWNYPSSLIVLGGTLGATFINYPLTEVIGILKVVKNAFFEKSFPVWETIDELVELSRKSRKSGILALEDASQVASDLFLRKGLTLLVDGLDSAAIEDIMIIDMDSTRERHQLGAEVLTSMGNMAPAMGLIGTLIGLVQMLQTMDEPAGIGPAMAVALLTTFYGAILANFIFLPLAGKLKRKSQQEIFVKGLVLEGVLSIARGENPRIMQHKLEAFLPPAIRREG
ncbi:MAG: motility protein A [Deltaproteobacteria bacterium]|nr:motility protein A [Candidatus Anaeroferrophillus wilburensis]MBN2889580.1 motility protein A [Deltaproteobacteria bacterium]